MNENVEKKEDRENKDFSDGLKKMADVDVKSVNLDELVEIDSVEVDSSLPVNERMMEYLKQIRNPYCYLCNGVVVKISFAGKERLEECLARALTLK